MYVCSGCFLHYYLVLCRNFPNFATKLNAYVETEEMLVPDQSHGEEGANDSERD